VDSSGNVFVADTFNDRIQKFQLANPCPSGTTQVALGVCLVKEWGGPGTGKGQFVHPVGLAVDSSGNVFVADTGNNRIQKFLLADPCPTGTTQVPGYPGVCYIIKWGGPGAGYGKFQSPRHIAVDSSGNVFVSDLYNNRIQKFLLADPCPGSTTQVDPGACYITEWGYGDALACILARTFVCHSSPNQFEAPYGVAVDSSGNVFVADYRADRIHEFIDDIIPPTVTITYPINGVTLTHNLPISPRMCIGCSTPNLSNSINVPAINVLPKLEIRATASDNVEVKKVEFYASGTNGGNALVGTDTTSPYSIPLTNLAPDTYTLTAKAYDTADNTKISTPITVSIK
jgi:sugar lactone lactonase YvrE